MHGQKMRVLDPMVGSGTTLVAARIQGHEAIGFDTDPLAVLIARAWSSDIDPLELRRKAREVKERARRRLRELSLGEAYPSRADEETRAFIRFWFDPLNRKQLAALTQTISRVRDTETQLLLWCALSRLVITKKVGVSLGMDISHSRPHRVYRQAPIRSLDEFLYSVEKVIKASSFTGVRHGLPSAEVQQVDARNLPLEDSSVDLVLTSPPYLNAIDYLRGHRLSLVWMGYRLRDIREIRSNNIGSEVSSGACIDDGYTSRLLSEMGEMEELPLRVQRMLARYVADMDQVLREIKRVVKPCGRVVLVVGDSTIRGVFVRNSAAIRILAGFHGLVLKSSSRRNLPDNRRYLPPPSSHRSGKQLQGRMREEVILTLKPS